MEKKIVPPFVVGVIIGLISIVLFLIFYFAGRTFQRDALSFLPLLIFLGLIIYFIIKWANDKDNNVTFGQCFGYGFKCVLVVALISLVFTLLFIFIFPDIKTQFLDFQKQQLEQNQQITDEQREQYVAGMGNYFVLIMLGGGLIGNLFIGVIASLIGAAVAKKNPQNPFATSTQL
jgi:cytochrome bd-type quinol oxidase subunit 2